MIIINCDLADRRYFHIVLITHVSYKVIFPNAMSEFKQKREWKGKRREVEYNIEMFDYKYIRDQDKKWFKLGGNGESSGLRDLAA